MTDNELHRPSKSALKREMTALQDLGKEMIALSDNELAKIPLADDKLVEAIATARRIKSNEGLRRQMQYIGKLMRQIDADAIREALEAREQGHRELARRFHALETLRDQLVEEGIAGVETAIEHFPQADRQHLRQLLLRAGKERAANKPPAAKRKLFQYLRELQQTQ